MNRCAVEGCVKPVFARIWCSAHYTRWQRHGDPLGGGIERGKARRFFYEVVLNFTGEECLIWPYSRSESGYGQLSAKGHSNIVSRHVCELLYGDPPTSKYEAAHSCGKGHLGCVNPKHLRWATSLENKADMALHGTSPRGERQGSSKLTSTEVLAIRKMRGKASLSRIAAQFNVSQSLVSRIHLGLAWAWLPDPRAGYSPEELGLEPEETGEDVDV